MPCGYYLEAAGLHRHAGGSNGNVFAVDADVVLAPGTPACGRPGILMAWAIHPEAYPEPPAPSMPASGSPNR